MKHTSVAFFYQKLIISNDGKRHLINGTAGFFCILVLLVFRPFGIRFSLLDSHFIILMVKYAVIITLVFTLGDKYLRPVLSNYGNIRKNRYRYHGFFFTIILTTVFLLCFLTFLTDPAINVIALEWNTLSISIQILFLLIVPLMIFLECFKNWISRSLQDDILSFRSGDKKSYFPVKKSRFLYAKNEDNYVSIYYLNEEGEIKTELIRNTLTNINSSVEKSGIVRCHRSYLVNPENVLKVKGPAKKMRLILDHVNHEIPVSRSNSHIFKDLK